MSLKQRLRGDIVPEVVRAKVDSRCGEELCDTGVSRKLAKVVSGRYKADGTDL